MYINGYLLDLLAVFYPRICPGCGMPLQRHEDHICMHCTMKLPRTGLHPEGPGALEKVFYGRIPVEQAKAFMFFRKKGIAQRLMHDLKYKGNKEIGYHLGSLFAKDLLDHPTFIKPEIAVSVPLHATRMRTRGFNQSDEIARGFAETLQIPFRPDIVSRPYYSDTQTRKKRFERWENAASVYEVSRPEEIRNRHIAIIDDVITTGATIEACARQMMNAPGLRLSVFSLCLAIN